MNGPLAKIGDDWERMVDESLAAMSNLLRRTASTMAHAQDDAARRDIEGSSEWRDLTRDGARYTDE